MVKKNYDYYYKRSSHGSTLSKVVHAYVSEIIGREKDALRLFCDALRSDIYDTQGGTTKEGIHVGVMGGTIDLVFRCFAGLEIKNDRLHLKPKLPKKWKRLKFCVRFRNIWFHIALTKSKAFIIAEPIKNLLPDPSEKIPVFVNGKSYNILAGRATSIPLK